MLPDTLLQSRTILSMIKKHALSIKPLIDDLKDTEFAIEQHYLERELQWKYSNTECDATEYSPYEIRDTYGSLLHNGYYCIYPIFNKIYGFESDFNLYSIYGCKIDELRSFNNVALDIESMDSNINLPTKELQILTAAYKSETVAILNDLQEIYVGCCYIKSNMRTFEREIYAQMVLDGSKNWRLSKSPDLIINLVDNLALDLDFPGVTQRPTYKSSNDKPLRAQNIDWQKLYDWAVTHESLALHA